MSLCSCLLWLHNCTRTGLPARQAHHRAGSLTPLGARGMSLIEVLVVIGLIGLMSAFALPRLNSSILNLSLAAENLAGDLRTARANALSRGARYRVTLGTTSYSVQRLQDSDEDGVWEPDARFAPWEVVLPAGISLTVVAGDGVIEFDTRGLIARPLDGSPPEIEMVRLSDNRAGDTRELQVWPSGQVLEG